ncbi:MAG: hypothetical protein R3249_05080 [Nitriliruptorales bacterium]|nr:hypothetical protein [Nitriliruptorales bacterium]
MAVDAGAGTVSVLDSERVVDVATGLLGPTAVAADPATDRLYVGLAGPSAGLASVLSLGPDGERSAIAWGLPGVADLAVLADGRILHVSGVDGALGLIDPASGDRQVLSTVEGVAVGLALLTPQRALVVTQGGLGTLVDIMTGNAIGVLPTSVAVAGRPAVLTEPSVVCTPNPVEGLVACSPLAQGSGFVIGDLQGVLGIAPAGPGRLLAARPDRISLVATPRGGVVQQWAVSATDLDVLSDPVAWLGSDGAPEPAPPPEGDVPLTQPWLLVLGVAAGVGAVVLTVVVRRASGVEDATAFEEDVVDVDELAAMGGHRPTDGADSGGVADDV